MPTIKSVTKTPAAIAEPHEPSPPTPIATAPSDQDSPAISAPPVAVSSSSGVAYTSAKQANWAATLMTRLEQVKRYPPEAAMQNQQGVVQLRFVVDRSGTVRAAKIEHSSGYDLLDREALAMVRRAQPLPPPPAQLSGERLDVVLPIHFFLKSRSK